MWNKEIKKTTPLGRGGYKPDYLITTKKGV
jgi:hypothetical protein